MTLTTFATESWRFVVVTFMAPLLASDKSLHYNLSRIDSTQCERFNLMKRACLLCNHSNCGYKTGCIAVRDGEVILEAYNETLPGEKYCQNGQCERHKLNLTGGREPQICCAIHAEVNLIAKAAAAGISLKDADLYVTTFPCYICAKSLVQAHIGRLFYMSEYMGGNDAKRLLNAAKIPVEQVKETDIWKK